MKALSLIILALLFTTSLCAVKSTRNEVVWWEEDFESAAPGWTHFCYPANIWHSERYWTGEGHRDRWVMGEGYFDHQYLVLDTPERTLADSNATLSFLLQCRIQGTAGATAPYDGWDAFNVRISTDGGTTWTPIYGTPAYNMSSSYAFGAEFGEGPGVPGWGGEFVWQAANFNLGAYIGQTVKIRFAFASDSTTTANDYYVEVSQISFGGYTNGSSGSYYPIDNSSLDDNQMTIANLSTPSEDIWQVAVDATAPSPVHIMKCQNTQGTYNANIRDFLISPPIDLPPDGFIRADFMYRGGMNDPEHDYVAWDVCYSIDGIFGGWFSMGPYSWPGFDPPATWSSMAGNYETELAAYAGQTVRFRWIFISDEDTPEGIGLLIDDCKILYHPVLNPPENLEATVNGGNIILTWNTQVSSREDGQSRHAATYKIYRGHEQIAMVTADLDTYTDEEVPAGHHSYYVTAADGPYESEHTNTVTVFLPNASHIELFHDDGTAENFSDLFQLAVKYTYDAPVTLRYVKVYVDSVGSPGFMRLELYVYDDDGPNGLPGSFILDYVSPNFFVWEGWNWIAVNIDLPEGQFYISVRPFYDGPRIGFDTSSHGFSYYQYIGTQWFPFTWGELMIRAIVEPTVANDDDVIPPLTLDLSNYPNPFNPETTISYTVPTAGSVSLEIYNSRGQLVRSLLQEEQTAGEHSLIWNGRDDSGNSVASGLYLCRITCNGKQETRKLLLLK